MERATIDGDRLRGLAAWCGPLTVAVSAVGILAATLLAPWFSWTGNALSDLGAVGRGTAPLFNGTLIVSGLLGVPFALVVLDDVSDWVRWVGRLSVAAAMPLLALVGVFALPSPEHGPVAVAFFVAYTVGIAVDGVGDVLADRRREGALSISLATLHVLAWVAWAVAGLEGIALPEIVGSMALWIWVLRRFTDLRA